MNFNDARLTNSEVMNTSTADKRRSANKSSPRSPGGSARSLLQTERMTGSVVQPIQPPAPAASIHQGHSRAGQNLVCFGGHQTQAGASGAGTFLGRVINFKGLVVLASLRREGGGGPELIGAAKDTLKTTLETFKNWLNDPAPKSSMQADLKTGVAEGKVTLAWEDDGSMVVKIDHPLVPNCRFETWHSKNARLDNANRKVEKWPGEKLNINKLNDLFQAFIKCDTSAWSWESTVDAAGNAQASEWKQKLKEIWFGGEPVLTGGVFEDEDAGWSCKTFLDILKKMQDYAIAGDEQ
jgi:hypothetical protein